MVSFANAVNFYYHFFTAALNKNEICINHIRPQPRFI